MLVFSRPDTFSRHIDACKYVANNVTRKIHTRLVFKYSSSMDELHFFPMMCVTASDQKPHYFLFQSHPTRPQCLRLPLVQIRRHRVLCKGTNHMPRQSTTWNRSFFGGGLARISRLWHLFWTITE